MNIIPSIKNTVVYTIIYGLYLCALFLYIINNDSQVMLLISLLSIIVINIVRFLLLSKKGLKVENNNLFINKTLICTAHKYKWLAFLYLDEIKYEVSPWQKKCKGTLPHYMYSKKQWTLLKNITSGVVQPFNKTN